ncbi:MAG: amino acid permease [Candidatus Bathyarchaeia archaeon]
MAERKTFVRRASGLVREVSAVDVLAYNMFIISLGYALFMFFYWVLYPGASLEWSIILTIVVSIVQGLVYALLASAYPRSGGDYVYMTRILHPALGFVMSWNFWIWMVFYVGLQSGMIGFQGLAPTLGGIGFITGDANLISLGQWAGTSNAYFMIGTAAIIIYALLLISGMKNYFNFQKVLFVIAMASTIVMMVLLATTSHETFVARFNALAKPYSHVDDTYSATIQTAVAEGFTPGAPISLLETVFFFVWPWLAIGYCMLSASYSGEVKSVKKSQIFGMLGSAIITGFLFILLAFLGGRVFGYNFIGAMGYLQFNDPAALLIPVTPWYNLWTALLTDNVALSSFILVGWFSWFLVLAVAAFLFTTRTSFAWAMDGMLPNAFSYVSERFRTPVNTIILSAVGAVIFLAGIAYTTWLGVLSGTLGIGLVWFLASVAAMIFPFRRRDFYKKSGINWEIAGVPVISILGLLNAITNGVAIYIMLFDWRAFANSPTSEELVGAFLVVGVIIFYVMKYVRKKQGVDVNLIFQEIPVE